MNSLHKIFSKFNIRSLSSSIETLKMSTRYFINKYTDYTGDGEVSTINEYVSSSINTSVDRIVRRLPPSKNRADGGLYVGISGCAYMFYHLANRTSSTEDQKNYIDKAIEYITPAIQSTNPNSRDATSFLLGDLGTYIVAAAIYKKAEDQNYKTCLSVIQSQYPIFLKHRFLKCESDELFVGRAGFISGVLWLRNQINEPVISNEDLYKVCDVIVTSGRNYSKKEHSPCPLLYSYYDTQYLGAAHGLCAILQTLISVPGYLEYNEEAATDIKASIDYMLSIQTPDGNWPCCMEELDSINHKLVHWCHGAPGVVYLMAKAFLVFKDQKYLNSCIKAADLVWEKGLLKKGPGICHGVAGNGYVFLLLYRLTKDSKHLHRALKYAEFLGTPDFKRARTPDNPESLYEGVAGTVCFLADLMTPDRSEFPFFDIFSTY